MREGRAGGSPLEPGGEGLRRKRAQQALGGRIAYAPTSEGWLYLAAVIDAFSRKVVGWSMSDRITEKVAIDAMEQAAGRENPPDDGSLVFHGDQGVQYTSKAFRRCLDSHGITQSASRPGTPLNNAVAESLFKTLKRELVKGKDRRTREELDVACDKDRQLLRCFFCWRRKPGMMSPSHSELAAIRSILESCAEDLNNAFREE